MVTDLTTHIVDAKTGRHTATNFYVRHAAKGEATVYERDGKFYTLGENDVFIECPSDINWVKRPVATEAKTTIQVKK